MSEIATRLQHCKRLTVVTNSPQILCQLQGYPDVTVMCIGGDCNGISSNLSGVWAQRALSEIRVDKAFMGVSAIDPSYGISTASHAEATIKKLIIKSAKIPIGLADHSKFGKQGLAYVGPVTEMTTLITDHQTLTADVQALKESGVEVVIAGPRTLNKLNRTYKRT